jgi:hypothetical protein
MIGRCKDCKYFLPLKDNEGWGKCKDGWGKCKSGKFIYRTYKGIYLTSPPEDCLVYWDSCMIGENFGCIHFQTKVKKNSVERKNDR